VYVQWIGWASSLLLVVTMANQVMKQWETRSWQGISPWLYAGQLAAEIGFVAFSLLIRNWVFIFSNGALLLLNLAGLALFVRQRRRRAR
jgi:MtN3 and saliva related transmembrane protein